MAHLLGSKYCIDSLRNDVTDLQEAVVDVFSRAGPVHCPSWKYPDKISSDLDMTDILERCEYSSEDEEQCQVSHILLLELVIDRLVLLMQAMAGFVGQVLQSDRRAASAQTLSHSSIGLVVKKYWSKMVQLQLILQQLRLERKNSAQTVSDLEESLARYRAEADGCSSDGPPSPLSLAPPPGKATNACTTAKISRDEYTKATQTLETAFVPCESCYEVQKHFRQAGATVVEVCSDQQLPCSLAKHKAQVEGLDWLSANDVTRWAVEMDKDLSRINRHMQSLGDLQTELEQSLKKNRELEKRNAELGKELRTERDTQGVQQRQYEAKLQQLHSTSRDTVAGLERQQVALEAARRALEERLTTAERERELLAPKAQQLEDVAGALAVARRERATLEARLTEAEATAAQLTSDLAEATGRLGEAARDLARERASNKAAVKQVESLQGKQDSLLQCLDQQATENEGLRERLGEMEGHLEQARRDTKRSQQQVAGQQTQINKLATEKEQLEQSISDLQEDLRTLDVKVSEAREQERLLVEYPDLNGPVNPDILGSGDLAKDMENQVTANCHRIRILEEQNAKLRHSVTKVMQAGCVRTVEVAGTSPELPVTLWKTDTRPSHANILPDEPGAAPYRPPPQSPAGGVPASHPGGVPASHPGGEPPGRRHAWAKGEEARQSFVVGRPTGTRPPSGRSAKGERDRARPLSTGTSSVSAYRELKKAGLIQKTPGKRGVEATGVPAPSNGSAEYQPKDVVCCPKCDKMYNSEHDLQLHRSYCYGPL